MIDDRNCGSILTVVTCQNCGNTPAPYRVTEVGGDETRLCDDCTRAAGWKATPGLFKSHAPEEILKVSHAIRRMLSEDKYPPRCH